MHIETSPQRFWQHVSEQLAPQEAYYNLMLGMLLKAPERQTADGKTCMASLSLTPGHLFLYKTANEKLLLAGTQTPEALSSHMPQVLDFIVQQGLEIKGIDAPTPMADRYVQLCQTELGQSWSLSLNKGVYQLDQVIPPPACPGHFRLAQAEDSAVLSAYHAAFVAESLPHKQSTDANKLQAVQQQIQAEQLFVWERDGQITSTAARKRETGSGTAISLVYTPPEWRGHGYASACVAALSQYLLNSGKRFCCLFTNLSNPTSNRIYERIGYTRIGTFAQYQRSLDHD